MGRIVFIILFKRVVVYRMQVEDIHIGQRTTRKIARWNEQVGLGK